MREFEYRFGIKVLADQLTADCGPEAVGEPEEEEWYKTVVDEAGMAHKLSFQFTDTGLFIHYFNTNRTYFFEDASACVKVTGEADG